MGNYVDKNAVFLAQSETVLKEHMVRSYIGWAVVLVLITVITIFFLCRYGTAKVKKWFLNQIGFVQERAIQVAQATRASFRRPRDPPPPTKIEIS